MTSKRFNTEEIYRLWARQLHTEFEDICWKYNINLLPPIFEISKSKKQLGSWQEDSRTIKISSFLITSHSWAVTLNILKHEIAHQICSEMFKSKEVAHGKDFSTACELLGLSKEYHKASGDLPKGIDLASGSKRLTSPEQSRFIDKVEKLLALAQSSNENEAALAMQKANELIEKYNIKQLSRQQTANYGYVVINKKKKRIETFQRQICTILRDFFYVKIIFSYLYDPESNQSHKTIEILGSCENIKIAEYCYFFLENQLSALWAQNRHRYDGKTRTEKNSYYLGVLKGFYDKLQNQKEGRQNTQNKNPSQSSTVNSLILAEDEKLNDYVAMRFPRLRTLSRRGPKVYRSTYSQGVETGKKITLNKGVTTQQGNKGKLLSRF